MSVDLSPAGGTTDSDAQAIRDDAIRLVSAVGVLSSITDWLKKNHTVAVLVPPTELIDKVIADIQSGAVSDSIAQQIVLFHITTEEELRVKKKRICPVPRYATMLNKGPLRVLPGKRPDPVAAGTLYEQDITEGQMVRLAVSGFETTIVAYRINRILEPLKLEGGYVIQRQLD